jgi:hypothetical protein
VTRIDIRDERRNLCRSSTRSEQQAQDKRQATEEFSHERNFVSIRKRLRNRTANSHAIPETGN